jgi:hypothetical protein
MKRTIPWARLSHEEKKAAVRDGRTRGLSDEAIASERGATKGQVVGFRHRHLPELTSTKKSGAKESTVATKATQPAKSAGSVPQTTQASQKKEKRRGRLAISEAWQCVNRDSNGHRCAYEYTDSETRRCDMH